MFDFGFGGSGLFRFLFRSFRWFRSGCSGGFVPVVPGFSTCPFIWSDEGPSLEILLYIFFRELHPYQRKLVHLKMEPLSSTPYFVILEISRCI